MFIKIKNLRWWIPGILALGTANSYIDRQSFPVVIEEIFKPFKVCMYDLIPQLDENQYNEN